jgi:hypothetical protein
MSTNFDPRSSTPSDLPYPLHRLNTPQTKLWLIFPSMKSQMASALVKKYPGGVGILSATQRLFALVDPRGNVRDLPPPHRRYEMWQIANQPRVPECPCADYFDPEVAGCWRERGENAGHHPLCQFDRSSATVFVRAAREAHEQIAKGGEAQKRPDEWLIMREEANR